MKPTCPQCPCTEFVRISDTIRRCARCRWLVRVQPDGTVRTAFDCAKPLERPRLCRVDMPHLPPWVHAEPAAELVQVSASDLEDK